MATKYDLQEWVRKALEHLGGSASLIEVAKYIWKMHESDLRRSGDLLYTWQYDMRWAANVLRHSGVMRPAEESARGVWELKK